MVERGELATLLRVERSGASIGALALGFCKSSVDFLHLLVDAILVVFEIIEEFSNKGEVELFRGVGWEFGGHDGN